MNGPSVRREDYQEREYTSGERNTIALHAQFVHGNDNLPGGWRDALADGLECFVKSECKHTTSSMFEVSNKHGVWGVLICDDCGRQSGRECPHVHLTWHEDGQVLICDNCGVDGT